MAEALHEAWAAARIVDAAGCANAVWMYNAGGVPDAQSGDAEGYLRAAVGDAS
jgi:hypothetical protein